MMFLKNKIRFVFAISLIVLLLVVASPTLAWGPLLGECASSTGCTLDDFGKLLINAAQMILGITGSLTLLFFVYGGFVWLTSGGNTEQIQKGKKILSSALIGLIIVLASYLIVNFTLSAITGGQVEFFGKPWAQL